MCLCQLTAGWRNGVDSGRGLAGSSNITNDVTVRHFPIQRNQKRMLVPAYLLLKSSL